MDAGGEPAELATGAPVEEPAPLQDAPGAGAGLAEDNLTLADLEPVTKRGGPAKERVNPSRGQSTHRPAIPVVGPGPKPRSFSNPHAPPLEVGADASPSASPTRRVSSIQKAAATAASAALSGLGRRAMVFNRLPGPVREKLVRHRLSGLGFPFADCARVRPYAKLPLTRLVAPGTDPAGPAGEQDCDAASPYAGITFTLQQLAGINRNFYNPFRNQAELLGQSGLLGPQVADQTAQDLRSLLPEGRRHAPEASISLLLWLLGEEEARRASSAAKGSPVFVQLAEYCKTLLGLSERLLERIPPAGQSGPVGGDSPPVRSTFMSAADMLAAASVSASAARGPDPGSGWAGAAGQEGAAPEIPEPPRTIRALVGFKRPYERVLYGDFQYNPYDDPVSGKARAEARAQQLGLKSTVLGIVDSPERLARTAEVCTHAVFLEAPRSAFATLARKIAGPPPGRRKAASAGRDSLRASLGQSARGAQSRRGGTELLAPELPRTERNAAFSRFLSILRYLATNFSACKAAALYLDNAGNPLADAPTDGMTDVERARNAIHSLSAKVSDSNTVDPDDLLYGCILIPFSTAFRAYPEFLSSWSSSGRVGNEGTAGAVLAGRNSRASGGPASAGDGSENGVLGAESPSPVPVKLEEGEVDGEHVSGQGARVSGYSGHSVHSGHLGHSGHSGSHRSQWTPGSPGQGDGAGDDHCKSPGELQAAAQDEAAAPYASYLAELVMAELLSFPTPVLTPKRGYLALVALGLNTRLASYKWFVLQWQLYFFRQALNALSLIAECVRSRAEGEGEEDRDNQPGDEELLTLALPSILTPANLLVHIMAKYNREFERNEMPVIRKWYRQEKMPFSTTSVLMVCAAQRTGQADRTETERASKDDASPADGPVQKRQKPTLPTVLLLTDGYYLVKGLLDGSMSREEGGLVPHTRLAVSLPESRGFSSQKEADVESDFCAPGELLAQEDAIVLCCNNARPVRCLNAAQAYPSFARFPWPPGASPPDLGLSPAAAPQFSLLPSEQERQVEDPGAFPVAVPLGPYCRPFLSVRLQDVKPGGGRVPHTYGYVLRLFDVQTRLVPDDSGAGEAGEARETGDMRETREIRDVGSTGGRRHGGGRPGKPMGPPMKKIQTRRALIADDNCFGLYFVVVSGSSAGALEEFEVGFRIHLVSSSVTRYHDFMALRPLACVPQSSHDWKGLKRSALSKPILGSGLRRVGRLRVFMLGREPRRGQKAQKDARGRASLQNHLRASRGPPSPQEAEHLPKYFGICIGDYDGMVCEITLADAEFFTLEKPLSNQMKQALRSGLLSLVDVSLVENKSQTISIECLEESRCRRLVDGSAGVSTDELRVTGMRSLREKQVDNVEVWEDCLSSFGL